MARTILDEVLGFRPDFIEQCMGRDRLEPASGLDSLPDE
jgi:hypothetical protein